MSSTTVPPPISVAENYKDLCTKTIEAILSLSQEAIKARGRCTIALAGGSTPQGVYALMADDSFRHRFDWKNIYFFLGDERWVPADSSRSNDKMIVNALIKNINIPNANFHPINTATSDVQSSASLYEQDLTDYFSLKPNEFPVFDLVLLGLGSDGHTASLFPNHAAIHEDKRLVVPVEASGLAEKRISLTLPVINHARAVFFLVSGRDKAGILKEILEGRKNRDLPAQKVKPEQGIIRWFVDKDAVFLGN